MNYKTAFQEEYLFQQGLESTQKNIQEYSIDPNQLELIHETPRYWVILNNGGRDGQWLNVIWKKQKYDPKRKMETIEL